jgi:hypothetical protein
MVVRGKENEFTTNGLASHVLTLNNNIERCRLVDHWNDRTYTKCRYTNGQLAWAVYHIIVDLLVAGWRLGGGSVSAIWRMAEGFHLI